MLDLDDASTKLLKALLTKHLPNVTVKAFGSRVTGTAQPYSDLDLLLCAKHPIDIKTLNALKFDLSNSDLPILVDLVDAHTISDTFHQAILQNCKIFIE